MPAVTTNDSIHKYRVLNQIFLLIFILCITSCYSYSQNKRSGDSVESFTLEQCVNYGLQHHPSFNRAIINKAVVKSTNAINLSGWLPQINLSGNMVHYSTLPTTLTPLPFKEGVVNSLIPAISVSENIFNPQLLYSANTASTYNKQAVQITDSTKIGIISNVSKSFYNLLLTLEEVNVLKEDTARLKRNIKDTYHQYIGGTVDETDYDEAVITLNNSLVQLMQQTQNISTSYAVLKQAMGYPPEKQFNVVFDTLQMMKETVFDTTQLLKYESRIEYQLLQTTKELQHQLTNYYKFSYIPTLSAVYNYYYEYENNAFSNLFPTAYPYSYIGLSLNFPIFTGLSRIENVHKSKLEEQELDWSEVGLKSQINTEYRSALANYKTNLYNWQLLKKNEDLSMQVYDIVSLQYQQGTVAYLNLIIAEDNLITAEIGYTNALFQLLSSKIDLEKALGILH